MSQKAQNNTLWFSVVVLFAINILNFYDRHVPGALVEPMRREFHLNDTQIGLIGSAFIWIYAIVGVPLGRIADSGSRKKLLAWGVIIWTALTASAGLATTYTVLLFSRVGVGVGEAACAPTATSWLGDLFPPAKRSRVLALFMLGVPVGGALGYFFSGPIAQAYGWRAAMVFAAVPALLLVPALFMLHEPQRGASELHPVPLAPRLYVERPAYSNPLVDHRVRRAAEFQFVRHRNFLARVPKPRSRPLPGKVGHRHGHRLSRWEASAAAQPQAISAITSSIAAKTAAFSAPPSWR